MVSPSPGGGWLVEDEECGVVVAMEELEVLDIAHSLTEISQADGVAGLDVMVLTAGQTPHIYTAHLTHTYIQYFLLNPKL